MTINGKIIDAELVTETGEEAVRRQNEEMRGEIAYLKKELYKLRSVAQSISGATPGGT
tara:strand:- start:917 stop:1090 length:174 start_codon:yes stop_codon:yes gene_type:complete